MSKTPNDTMKQDLEAIFYLKEELKVIVHNVERKIKENREPLDYVLCAYLLGEISKATFVICNSRVKDNSPRRTLRSDTIHPETRRAPNWSPFDEFS